MRVVHVISALDPLKGGPITALLGLTAAQQRQGMQVSLAATWAAGEVDDPAIELRRNAVDVQLIGPTSDPLRRHARIIPVLRGLISAADIVHIHALYEEVQHQAARLSREIGVPYLFTPHGMLDPWSLAQSGLKKRLYMFWRLQEPQRRRGAPLHKPSRT